MLTSCLNSNFINKKYRDIYFDLD